MPRKRPLTPEQQNRLLQRLSKAQDANQAVADRILSACAKKGLHVRILVSSSGLTFNPLDARSAAGLAQLLNQSKSKPKLLKGGTR